MNDTVDQSRVVLPLLLTLWLVAAGCSSNTITRPDKWAVTEQPQQKTVWTFFWGAMHQNINPTNCVGPGLAEVTVKSNVGFALISLASLGAAMPVTVEWRCAKDKPTGGDDF